MSNAEHAAVHTNALPDDASAQDILAHVPVYDAQAAVRSALAMWVGVVRERAEASVQYNYKHTQACAVVLPILDQIVRDADGIGWHRRTSYFNPSGADHWADHVFVPPLGSGSLQMADIFSFSGGYMHKNYGERIEEIKKRIFSYPWLASWLRG